MTATFPQPPAATPGLLAPRTPALVVVVGKTEARYRRRRIDDLHSVAKQAGDSVPLGGGEQQPAADSAVEARGRSPEDPI